VQRTELTLSTKPQLKYLPDYVRRAAAGKKPVMSAGTHAKVLLPNELPNAK